MARLDTNPTDNGYSQLRAILRERRARLMERFRAERDESQQRHATTNEPMDEADRGKAETDVSYLEQLSERDQQALMQVDDALERIENGEYGICDRCEEPIGGRRLVAIPETRLCVDCAEMIEHEQRIGAPPAM